MPTLVPASGWPRRPRWAPFIITGSRIAYCMYTGTYGKYEPYASTEPGESKPSQKTLIFDSAPYEYGIIFNTTSLGCCRHSRVQSTGCSDERPYKYLSALSICVNLCTTITSKYTIISNKMFYFTFFISSFKKESNKVNNSSCIKCNSFTRQSSLEPRPTSSGTELTTSIFLQRMG